MEKRREKVVGVGAMKLKHNILSGGKGEKKGTGRIQTHYLRTAVSNRHNVTLRTYNKSSGDDESY